MSLLEKIFGIEKEELTIVQLQEMIEQDEDEILKLSKVQVEQLKQLYQEETKALEAEIKFLQTQKNMYLFNIRMYEKGA